MPYQWLKVTGEDADLPIGNGPIAVLDMDTRVMEFQENLTVRGASGVEVIVQGSNAERYVDVTITTGQLLALNATPIEVVAAPGPNKAVIFEGAVLHKPAGTAYAAIAAGEDLSFKYTNGSGLEVAVVETTGFLDQATAQTRYARPQTGAIAAGTVSSVTPVANAALVLQLLVGEITTGDSALIVRVFYRVVPTVLP